MENSCHEVFISYSSDDVLIAQAVCHRLEEDDVRCWMAPRDVIAGRPFEGQIVRAIKGCAVMVLIFSPRSNASVHVGNEVAQAFKANKIIIPFIVEETVINDDLDYYLSNKHWLVAYPDYREKTDDLSDTVRRLLQKEPKQEEPNKPSVAPSRPVITKPSGAEIHIDTDVDCEVFRFNDKILDAVCGEDNIIYLNKGKHKVTFVSKCFPDVKESVTLDVPSADYSDYVVVQLLFRELEKIELKIIRIEDKYGYVDASGNIRIPAIYGEAFPFREGLALVSRLSWVEADYLDWGFIDKTGRVVVPLMYDYASDFHEGLALVQTITDGVGYVDKSGVVVIPLEYDDGYDFREGLATVMKDGKYGCIDRNGRVVIPFVYSSKVFFIEGLAAVEKDGRHGFIDKTGRVAIPFKYDEADYFREGLAAVKCAGKYGFINKSGRVVIPIEYDKGFGFCDGVTIVKKEGKYAIIDKSGQVVSNLDYDRVDGFRDGRALVKKDGKVGLIDKTGQLVGPLKK